MLFKVTTLDSSSVQVLKTKKLRNHDKLEGEGTGEVLSGKTDKIQSTTVD